MDARQLGRIFLVALQHLAKPADLPTSAQMCLPQTSLQSGPAQLLGPPQVTGQNMKITLKTLC